MLTHTYWYDGHIKVRGGTCTYPSRLPIQRNTHLCQSRLSVTGSLSHLFSYDSESTIGVFNSARELSFELVF